MRQPEESAAVRVARGTSYILLQNTAANVMMVVSFSILARLISPVEMGGIAVLLIVIGAARVVACLGMPTSVTKFMAESISKNDRAAAAGVFYQAIRTSLLLSLPVGAAVFWWAEQLSARLLSTPEKAIIFQIVGLGMVVSTGLLPALNSAMLGLQKIREMSTTGLVYMAIRQSLIVCFTFATRSLVGVVTAWVLSETVLALAFLKYIWSTIGPPSFTFELKRLVRFSFPLFLQDAASYLYTYFDRAILLAYVSLGTLGIYAAVITAFDVLGAVAAAVGTCLFPTYAALGEKRGSQVLSDSITGATRYLCLLVTPLSFGLLSTARPLLALFVGEPYTEGTETLMILSLFFAFTLTSTALAGITVVLGETFLSLKLSTLSVLVGIVSTLILLPPLGIMGAAIARGITMATNLIAATTALKRRIRIAYDMSALGKSFISSGVMAVVVLLVQFCYYDKYLLPAYVAIGGSVYFAELLALHAISTQDIELLEEYLGPRFRFIIRPLRRLATLSARGRTAGP